MAAAHLLCYYPDQRAGKAYRGVGEIHWLLFWPEAPAGPGGGPGHCLGICLPGSMNGFGTVIPWWRPVGVWTSNSWPSGSASSIGSIA